MSVQEQIPYVEYVGNGVTKAFPVTFDFEDQDHLIVTVDGTELSVGQWSLLDGRVEFKAPPSSGALIEIKRDTPLERSTNYQTYNNSFRPEPVNQDFDRIWWKLQELGLADWLLGLRIDKEIRDRIAADIYYYTLTKKETDQKLNDLKNYIDDLVNNITGEAFLPILDRYIKTWSGRSQEQKNKDSIHVLDFKFKNGVEIPDQEAIQDAVSYCLLRKICLDWEGAHLISTTNIPDFWLIQHKGQGSIRRGKDTFNISPEDTELNILYVKSGGSSLNDGLGEDQAISYTSIPDRMRKIGVKSGLGQWRFKLSGEIITNGIRLDNTPTFNRALQFYGDEVAHGSECKTIVRGQTKNSNVYAILSQNSTNFQNIEFKYIKFTEWQGANPDKPNSNSGGIVIWNPCRVVADKCAFDTTSIGVSVRQGYLKLTGSLLIDNVTFGANAMYSASANIGNLSGGGNIFVRSNAVVGRASIMYIQGNEIIDCKNPIQCTRVSRVRTQGNVFESWTGTAISCDLNSTYTPDNGAGSPDIIKMMPSFENPFFKATAMSSHLHIHNQGNLHHYTANTCLVENKKDNAVLLSSIDGEYVPFRLPEYTLFGKFRLELKLWFFISQGAGGVLSLNSKGTGSSSILASLSIPKQEEDRYVEATITVMSRDNDKAFYNIACPQLGINRGATVTLTTSMRSPDETRLIWRLYLTPLSDEPIVFRGLQSEVNI